MGPFPNALGTYIEESVIQFITGAEDLEANWDKFVSEIEKIGANDVIAHYETAIERYNQR